MCERESVCVLCLTDGVTSVYGACHVVFSIGKAFAGGRVFSRDRSRQTVPVPATETHVRRFTGKPEESRT